MFGARQALVITLSLLSLAWTADLAAEAPLPIFDAHVHYSQDAWSRFDSAAVTANMDQANVPRALVSSTPDDGTLRLHAKDPSRFVPMRRLYRGDVHSGNWFDDAATPAYLAERLKRGIYKGIGEFHLFGAEAAATPVMAEVAKLALAHDIVLHVHSGAAPVAALFRLAPDVKILWAHAGMTTPAAEVGRLLDAQNKLSVEVAFRAGDIAPGGTLDATWRDLLLRHADRFLIGTDTYVNGRWEVYGSLIAEHRRWLKQLPRPVAEAIAYRNAVRLFGDGGRRALTE